jgi:phosphonate transport system ATP-binding protein
MLIDSVPTDSYKSRDWDAYRNHSVGFIFQSYNLIPHQTLLRNVELALTLGGVSREEGRSRAEEELDRVGLKEQMHKKPDQLSGGQMQRVALARTLDQSPSIILADEPVASLDPIMADVVMSDFRRINEEMNITILLNIHHVDLALKYATRVIGVRAGEIVYDGPSSQVTKDVLNQVYNGQTVPTTENDTKPGKADNTDSAGKKELRA